MKKITSQTKKMWADDVGDSHVDQVDPSKICRIIQRGKEEVVRAFRKKE